MSNLAVNLVPSPTSPIVYNVTAGSTGLPYTGQATVVITDATGGIVYNGSALTYSTTIL
jgi:hypothetical protein